MILHQQLPHRKDAPLAPWFAVHVESVTIVICRPYGDSISISSPVPEITGPSVTSCEASPFPGYSEQLISDDLRRHGKTAVIHPPIPINSQSPFFKSQPYLLLNSLDGTTPAIMHTVDPVFICLADRKTAILHPTEHFRSSVDLSVEGWTYWHEDAQAHFEKLTVEFCQATGIPIPARIAAAVRHT